MPRRGINISLLPGWVWLVLELPAPGLLFPRGAGLLLKGKELSQAGCEALMALAGASQPTKEAVWSPPPPRSEMLPMRGAGARGSPPASPADLAEHGAGGLKKGVRSAKML